MSILKKAAHSLLEILHTVVMFPEHLYMQMAKHVDDTLSVENPQEVDPIPITEATPVVVPTVIVTPAAPVEVPTTIVTPPEATPSSEAPKE